MNNPLALAALLGAACANPSNQSNPAASQTLALAQGSTTPGTTVRQQFPMRLRWEERALTETGATLVAHVERLNALRIPFVLQVELPAGVKVERGRTRLELPPNSDAVETTEEYVLTFATAPAQDALLLVDGENQAMGFHGKVAYRFGRTSPAEPHLDAAGPSPTGTDGKAMGPSIPLTK